MHDVVREQDEVVLAKTSLEMLQEGSRRRRLVPTAMGVSSPSPVLACGISEKVAGLCNLLVCATKSHMPLEDGNANGRLRRRSRTAL